MAAESVGIQSWRLRFNTQIVPDGGGGLSVIRLRSAAERKNFSSVNEKQRGHAK